MSRIWIVIPAHNEEKNISGVVKKCRKYIPNIIVVDDGSKDRTSAFAKRAGAEIIRHPVNLGKGAALKTGCDIAKKWGAKSIVLMDSDGQHDPADIPKFLAKLKKSEMVIGEREIGKNMPLVFSLGNLIIASAAKVLFGIRLKDTQCGYKAFSTKIYQKIRWRSLGYAVESEILANAGKNRVSYSSIPIKTVYRDKYKGTTVFDGIGIVLNMIKWRFLGPWP